jgi:hypothetical protein
MLVRGADEMKLSYDLSDVREICRYEHNFGTARKCNVSAAKWL